MSYRPLNLVNGTNHASPSATPSTLRSRLIDGAFSSFQRRSPLDELPLLDVPSLPKMHSKGEEVSSSTTLLDHLDHDLEGAVENNRYLMKSDKSDQPGLTDSLRARFIPAYRYVRASGAANTSSFTNDDAELKHRRLPTGWRLGTWACCLAIILCLAFEVALLIYARMTSRDSKNGDTLLEGRCEEVRELELWLLLPLNIAGTILIGTSNYVMQVVSAPERKEIDEAHAVARSIAVAGLRFNDLMPDRGNKVRRAIWWTLGLSSVPIHFLLNVAVYSSIQASNLAVLVVADNFHDDTGWDYCNDVPPEASIATSTACSLFQNYTRGQTLQMTTSQCLRQYSHGFQTNASSVIVVTDEDRTPWYNPPIAAKVPDYVSYGLTCRDQYKMCEQYISSNDTYQEYKCNNGYAVVEDLNYNITYNLTTSYVAVDLDFYPYCENKTIYTEEGVFDHWEIQLTTRSQGRTYSNYDDLSFWKNDSLATNITSIKALFSAFQYRYWASADITGDYLRGDYESLLSSRDPRSWLCPYEDLENTRQCNPLDLQQSNEWTITPESMPVRECHVLPKEELCTLRYSSNILIITICFDVVKLLAMFAALTLISKPLTTLGDIIESFLRDPDSSTEGRLPLDDDQADTWTYQARRKISADAFEYLKKRFGVDILMQSKCRFCGKRLRLKSLRTKNTIGGIDLSHFANHRDCGIFPLGSRDGLMYEEQCITWLMEGGPWWRSVSTAADDLESKILAQRRWFRIPSKSRWRWFVRLYLSALALAVAYFAINFRSLVVQHLLNPWIVGFDAPDPNSMLTQGLAGTKSIYAAAMLVNAPQLAFSMLYFIFNATLTLMHTAHEWASFAVERKALRVSSPRGQQRATYWLQLPWSYSIPLIVTSGSIHWLLSRSLYIVKVDVYGYLGGREIDKDYFACGYSPIPALLLVLVLLSMGIVIFGLGFRRLPTGMPFVRLNSIAIAAACHPSSDEKDAELEPLMWGIREGYSSTDKLSRGFSARPVTRVQYMELPST